MTCRENVDLGAYVLGALAPAERSAMERHLTDCPHCTAELLSLAPLPGLLRHTPFDELAETASVDTADRPPRAAYTPAPPPRRRRPNRLVGAALALSALGVTAAVVVGLESTGDSHGSTASNSITLSNTDPATHVRASVDLTPETWGTALRLKLDHLPPGAICHLVVHSRHGGTETSGTWSADYGTDGSATGQNGGGASSTIPASTSISPQDIAAMEVVTDSNQVLVRVR